MLELGNIIVAAFAGTMQKNNQWVAFARPIIDRLQQAVPQDIPLLISEFTRFVQR
jgi:hypothetical protein